MSTEDKIRIRMANGKIYGPYSRDDVTRFIRLKKIHGDEDMLFLSDGRWVPVSSDPEFFDLIQEILDGKPKGKSALGSKKKSGERKLDPDTRVDQVESGLESMDGEVTSISKANPENDPPSDVTKTFMPFKEDLSGLHSTSTGEESLEGVSLEKDIAPVSALDRDKKSPNRPKLLKRKRASRPLLYFSLLVVLMVIVGLMGRGESPTKTKAKGIALSNNLRYFKVLKMHLSAFEFSWPMPDRKISLQEGLPLESGFGAHYWLGDMMYLDSEELLRGTSMYWFRMAWNAKWLSETIRGADLRVSTRFAEYAEKILEKLKADQVVTPLQVKALEAISLVASGKWEKAKALLEGDEENSYVIWLRSMLQFLEFLDHGRVGATMATESKSNNAFLDLSETIRRQLMAADRSVVYSIEQLLEFDPQSYDALSSLAQFYWRLHSSGVPRAQQAFLSLLSVVSLYPMSFQAISWKEYAGLQEAFGREDARDKAVKNFKLLAAGTENMEASSDFWDIESEGLSASNVAELIVKRMERNSSNLIDIAHLENVSYPLKDNDSNFLHVIYYSIFYKDFRRAKKLAQFILDKDPVNVGALGAMVWIYAQNYKFDEAFEFYDRIVKSPKATGDAAKYNGLIHYFGRDYQTGRSELEGYLKNQPNDGMAHYFLAMLHVQEGKNHDCVKAANLARIHGRGAIRFLSDLLFFRCRVLAKLAVDEAIRELKKAYDADQYNVFLFEEYVFSLYEAGLTEQAFEVAKEGIRNLPHAYHMKIVLGDLYEKEEKWDEALLFYNDARKLRPQSTLATVKIGDMFMKKKRFAEAAQNYLSAARFDPEYPDLYLLAARAFREGNKKVDAFEMYKRELSLRPAVLRTFLETAEFLLEANLPSEVPKLFQQYEDNYRGDPRVMVRLAQAYWAMQDLDNSEKMAKLALQRNNKLAEPYRILGRIYDRGGQYQLAKDNFEKYLLLLPQAADAEAIREKLNLSPYE